MSGKYLKIARLLSWLVITCFLYGCANTERRTVAEQNEPYTPEKQMFVNPWDHTTKVAPLFSKKIIFADDKKEENNADEDVTNLEQ